MKDAPIIINKFKIKNINYFDSDLDTKVVKIKKNKTIYYNVFVFTNRLRIKVTPENTSIFYKNFDFYLLSKANRWYTKEFNYLARLGLRNNPDGVTEWCGALERRFREIFKKNFSTF